jgi:hypothetical protein
MPGVVPFSVEICSAGLSRLRGFGSRFNGTVGDMLGLVGSKGCS